MAHEHAAIVLRSTFCAELCCVSEDVVVDISVWHIEIRILYGSIDDEDHSERGREGNHTPTRRELRHAAVHRRSTRDQQKYEIVTNSSHAHVLLVKISSLVGATAGEDLACPQVRSGYQRFVEAPECRKCAQTPVLSIEHC